MLLEPTEKKRFIEWLNLQIASNEGLIKASGNLQIPGLDKKFKAEILACKVVLKMLEDGEQVTL